MERERGRGRGARYRGRGNSSGKETAAENHTRVTKELQQCKEPSQTAASLLQYRDSFQNLVNADSIEEGWMKLLIEILGKMCSTAIMPQNMIEVMSVCKGSAFMCNHLPRYIIQLPMIQEEKQDTEMSLIIRSLITFFRE